MADESEVAAAAAAAAPDAAAAAPAAATATASADDDAAAATAAAAASNALEHNIRTKGKNSYYYAHANNLSRHNVGTHGGEPKLLHRASTDSTSTPMKVTSVAGYAWMDGKKTVKVMIDWEGADGVADEDLELTWTAKSVRLDIKAGGRITRFDCPKLSDEIKGAKLRKKAARFDIVLKKSDELAWLNLKEQ